MHDVELDTKLHLKDGVWKFSVTGPTWLIEEFMRHIHEQNAVLYLSGSGFSSARPEQREVSFSLIPRDVIAESVRLRAAATPGQRDEEEQ